MAKRIAVIGAGASGVAAAKACVQCSLDPIVYESAECLGGLWRPSAGFVWPDMRTNLSKWSCEFSDFPWPIDAEDFPQSSAVAQYLAGYAAQFSLYERIVFGTRVQSVTTPTSIGWELRTVNGTVESFDGVVAASGIFAVPFTPAASDASGFQGASLTPPPTGFVRTH